MILCYSMHHKPTRQDVNIVAVGKTLKLNNFNIDILCRWNTTSNTPCGFPAQYPKPQWYYPEGAQGSDHLTEEYWVSINKEENLDDYGISFDGTFVEIFIGVNASVYGQ
eukprot:8775248-Ditylum_brightwellii.AAC.1